MVTDFSCKKVNSKYGVLSKDVKKVTGALSHYKFRQRLQNKCAEYRCQYLEVTEEWTSKTCCMCGSINMKLKDDRTLFCKTCEVIDRDVNGSINIFIKNRHEVLDI
jgi:transposase